MLICFTHVIVSYKQVQSALYELITMIILLDFKNCLKHQYINVLCYLDD